MEDIILKLVGPAGSKKTTLLNYITDLLLKYTPFKVKKVDHDNHSLRLSHQISSCDKTADIPQSHMSSRVTNIMQGNPNLGDCLDEAKQCITGERQDSYGNPEDSFALIAQYWSSYISQILNEIGAYDNNDDLIVISLDTTDTAHMMMLMKIARCSGQLSKRDNYIDIAGYASIAADILVKE